MGAGRNLLAFCLPLAVLCHQGHFTGGPNVQSTRTFQDISLQPNLPLVPIDGRRCISVSRQTQVVEVPLPYLCIPGKPGGVPLPSNSNKRISNILVAMYWNGWRVCKQSMKVSLPKLVEVSTCCPGWESGPSGECNVPVGRQMTSPCVNGGFMAAGNGMPRCVCPTGFSGVFCQIPDRNTMRNMASNMNLPLQMPSLPEINQLMEMFQQQVMQSLGPKTLNDIMSSSMPPSIMASLIQNGPDVTELMNVLSQVTSQQAPVQVKSIMTISKNSPTDIEQPVPGYKIGDVNTRLPAPVRVSPHNVQPNIIDNSNQQQSQSANIPQNNNPSTFDGQMGSVRLQLPPFAIRLNRQNERCEEILKMGITRCIREAGVQAFPNDIFNNRSPHLTRVICSKGGQIGPCVMGGQNVCGTGLQVVATRRMLSSFLTSIGEECNSMMQTSNVVPQLNQGMPPLNIPTGNMPNPAMIPLPPMILRNLQDKRPNHVVVNPSMASPVSPLAQDLETLECLNGGFAILDSGRPICKCLDGFEGEHCETPFCIPECLNGGVCDSVEGTPMCICVEGFSGIQCEESVGPIPDISTGDITAAVESSIAPVADQPLENGVPSQQVDTALTPDETIQEDIKKISQSINTVEAVQAVEPTKEAAKTVEQVNTADTVKPVSEPASPQKPSGEKQTSGAQPYDSPAKKDMEDDTIYIAGYPLWLILSVSIGFLLLVIIFTVCVCVCVKQRSKRFVDITAVPAALPEKAPIKDSVYVVGIPPPPVYEVKGIPNLCYEEAKGEVINASGENQNKEVAQTPNEEGSKHENTHQVTRI